MNKSTNEISCTISQAQNSYSWRPSDAQDKDRQEGVVGNPCIRNFADKLTVSNSLGYKINKILYEKMKVELLYWSRAALSVRIIF